MIVLCGEHSLVVKSGWDSTLVKLQRRVLVHGDQFQSENQRFHVDQKRKTLWSIHLFVNLVSTVSSQSRNMAYLSPRMFIPLVMK